MRYKSQLALVVANQLGNLIGRLESTLLVRLSEKVSKFSKACPNVNELRQLINLLNNISSSLAALEGVVSTFRRTSDKLTPVINTLTTLINTLRLLPIPTAVAGVGVPLGLTNRYAELLVNTSDTLESFKEEQKVINRILNNLDTTGVSSITTRVSQQLEVLLQIVSSCAESNPELRAFLTELQQRQNSLLGGTDVDLNTNLGLGPNNSYKATNGRIYFFEIINNTEIEAPVDRRQAIAKDNTGVIVIKGEPSFSSSTKVLIDELKLRIERQLP